MIWFAAMMMVAQATSGATGANAAPQAVPALTAQQKQELSTYNFKNAGAALNAQTNQPAKRLTSLTPIPPLQVPRIAKPDLSGQSCPVGTSVDKGSAVPPGWKPPHAELNTAAVSAAAVPHQWEAGVATPTPGSDGRVIYVFGQGMPVMVCARCGCAPSSYNPANIFRANRKSAIPVVGRSLP